MNSFPRHSPDPRPMDLRRAAELVGAAPPSANWNLRGVQPLDKAGPDEIGLLVHRRYLRDVPGSAAGAILVSEELAGEMGEDERPRLVVPDAYEALAILLEAFHPEEEETEEIHPTAVLGRGVSLGKGVRVGPYAVLEEDVVVGDGARIGAHCVVGARATLGRNVRLHPQVVLYPGVRLGDGVILHAGARIGVDGFGYASSEKGHRKIPQLGACIVEDDVEVGANAAVDRGSIGETRIGAGGKLDNLVQIGHNVVVGPRSILSGQAGVAGSTRLGAGIMAGGQAGIGGHLRVGDGARLAAQAGIMGDIPPGETVMGFPARPRMEFLRATAAQARVPALAKKVKELEGALAELRATAEELRGGGDRRG